MDGLKFCKNVYDMFEQLRSEPNGISKLRMRPTKEEKRFTEELIDIARYVQARYMIGRCIKVRWRGGSQPYDAVLLSSGAAVENGFARRKVLLEVTKAVHQNEYLVRERINKGKPSFGVKGASRDKTTKEVTSAPYGRQGDEAITDLAEQILERLVSKAAKPYPPNTVLLISCVPNTAILVDEWLEAIARVKAAGVEHPFCEVFVLCGPRNEYATI